MAILSFCSNDVERIVRHARGCTEHRATFEHMSLPEAKAFLVAGYVISDAERKREFVFNDAIDQKKIPPAIHFVKDSGIYLMSNGVPRDLVASNASDEGDDRGSSFVVYARGFDPSESNDCWERCRNAVGGDDFVEHFNLDDGNMPDILSQMRVALNIQVNDDNTLTVSAV